MENRQIPNTDTSTDIDTNTNTNTDTNTHTHTHTRAHTHTHRHMQTYTHTHRGTERDRERQRETERDAYVLYLEFTYAIFPPLPCVTIAPAMDISARLERTLGRAPGGGRVVVGQDGKRLVSVLCSWVFAMG